MKNTSKSFRAMAAVSIIAASGLQLGCQPASTEQTPKAEMTSGVLFNNFDTQVRPQDDFYEYVNGTWLKTTEIPDDRSSHGSFGILRDEAEQAVHELMDELLISDQAYPEEISKVKDLYQTFMDEAAIEAASTAPYQKLAEEIDQLSSKQALAQYLANPWMQSGLGPIRFTIWADLKNPEAYTVYLDQAGLSLPDRDYYFDESERGQTVISEFKAHLVSMFALAGEENPEATADLIWAIESELAQGQWVQEDLRDVQKIYNPTAASTLPQEYPGFAWTDYLSASGIGDHSQIIVGQPSYFDHLQSMIAKRPLEDWQTYLKWRTLTYLAPYMASALADEDFDFFSKTLYGVKEQRARWKRAVRFSSGIAGEAIGKLYVARHFPPEAKERMVELVEKLRQAYRISIQELDWMSAETKAQAIVKLEKFIPKIGYPDQWQDYSKLTTSQTDLVTNVLAGRTFKYEKELAKLGQPIDRHEWLMTPQTVNAYYNPSMNEIVFPAAILQPPFFDLNADDAVNYGAIGGVIGHEMGHGFDDQGAQYDGDGKLDNWWSKADEEAFKARAQALVAQYDAFEPLPDLHVNGQLTLGENIGDLGGLTIAYKAYQLSLEGKPSPVIDGLTGEQRLFIGWAQAFNSKRTDESLTNLVKTDPHSPSMYRVNGVVRNMPEFVEAFNVTPGDALYLPPDQRVKIW